MIRSGERLDLSVGALPDGRQALHRRGRRQDLAAALPAGRRLRRRGAAALGPRPRPHRRHARQARVDPRLPHRPHRPTEFVRQLADIGAVICAAGADLAPADRKLYALRDVTGTVESIPLIASSIMSKKIAEGTDALVLDVKVGVGAFMRDRDRARELARTMVGLGEAHGVRTVGAADRHGHAPRARRRQRASRCAESLEVLEGGGPADVVEVTLALAREMLALAGIDADPAAALADGRAMDRWRRDGARPGRRPRRPAARRPARRGGARRRRGGRRRRRRLRRSASRPGRLGAGRARKEDPVSPSAGVVLRVVAGRPRRRRAGARRAARRRRGATWRPGGPRSPARSAWAARPPRAAVAHPREGRGPPDIASA